MTTYKPYLIVNKLRIYSGSKAVYNQDFCAGVNIIRGDNGTGKSTVMDLLFYVLGGDVKEWTEEQSRCDFVLCEVSLSGKVVTLRREISDSSSAPMFLYEGPLDSEMPVTNWVKMPYKVSERRESFSETLFDLLGLPRHKKDDKVNLTMHQILRLLYVDQITPPNKILRQEGQFDGALNRQAIGEYLLGLDDLNSHALRQQKNLLEKRYDSLVVERNAVYKILGKHAIEANEDRILRTITDLNHEKERLQAQLKDPAVLLEVSDNSEARPAELKNKVVKVSSSISMHKDTLMKLESRQRALSDEILETELFLDSLQFRLKSLVEASAALDEIGNMEFRFCPSCLSPILPSEDHNTCHLCKSTTHRDLSDRSYLAERNALQFQIKESTEILEKNKTNLLVIKQSIAATKAELELLLDSYEPLGNILGVRESVLYSGALRLGSIERELKQLAANLEIIREIEEANRSVQDLKEEIARIESKLAEAEARSMSRRDQLSLKISTLVLQILKRDLGYETAFENAQEFFFDFGRDAMYVDGRSKFSASSMTLLKNAFRFAIFFLSVMDKDMRYPRFLIMDNVEDKGMVPARSQNFQRIMVEYCSQLDGKYQLIFTTSMIDPELNQSSMCRGINYLKGQHTLVFE